MEYSGRQRELAVNSRLEKIMDVPKPDYPEPRKPGKITMELNGKTTIALLEPYPYHIEQWFVKINGKELGEGRPLGMNKVYRELARLNPPASNFS